MGRDGGTNAALPLSLVDAFTKACPVYMSYGMTYEQFWDGDVCAHKAYKEAAKLLIKRQNEQAHLQGAYIYEALAAVAPLFRGMKPSRAQAYRKEPYDIFAEDAKRREEEEQRKRYVNIKDKVAAFAKAFNDKRKSKNEEVGVDAGCVP